MSITHGTVARLTAGAAALSVAAGLAATSTATAAEGAWVDGDWVQETIISCATGQPAPGYTARASFQGVGEELPQVGQRFWIRMEVGLVGLPCTQRPEVLPEIVLPQGLEYADDAEHPVRWAMYDVDGGGSGWSTDDLVYDLGVNGGVLVGLKSDDYPDGGPIEVRQGESLEIQVPVRATKVMKGPGTRQPQCQERLEGEAPCPVDESGDHLQVAFTKSDSGPMDYVIPFVGLLVQKAKVALEADVTAYARKPGTARLALHAPTVPTGKVAVLEGRKVLADGTLKAGNDGRISLRLPRLSKGKHTLTVKYAGSATAAAAKRKVTVTSR